jgi:hypothetical protein
MRISEPSWIHRQLNGEALTATVAIGCAPFLLPEAYAKERPLETVRAGGRGLTV